MGSVLRRLSWCALLCWPCLAAALDGRVVDASSGLPIAGATVIAGADSTLSGNDGGFHLPAAGGQVSARAIGYSRATATASGQEAAVTTLRLFPLRPKALYLSAYGIGNQGLRDAALHLLATTELNALVIDLKGDTGMVPYPSQVPQAALCGARVVTTVRDMAALAAQLRRDGIYLIARIVAFKDDRLASAHPEWSVKNADGEMFRDREQQAWIDPFQRDAWAYLLDLAQEAAAMGFDEIQFDYVRFPDTRGLRFAQPNTEANRVVAITGFLQAARQRLAPYNAFLAADLFGYTAWNSGDTEIGQDLPAIAKVVDYISPMLYPSGYQFGIPGVPDPMQEPALIVQRTLQRAMARTGGNGLRFRPWLQAFRDYAFDHRPFDADEIRAQIDAAESAGTDGWMLWNPRNSYSADGPQE